MTSPPSKYTYGAELLSLYDPDTFTVRLQLGFDVETVQVIRVHHVDVLEKYGTRGTCQGCGERHTQAEKDVEKEGCAIAIFETLELFKNAEEVVIHTLDKGKYGRWLGETFFLIDGEWINLAHYLIENGWAIGYEGGTKYCVKDWYNGFN